MKSCMGVILEVDLGTGEIKKTVVPDQVYAKVLSGKGLSAWYLLRNVPDGADPLGTAERARLCQRSAHRHQRVDDRTLACRMQVAAHRRDRRSQLRRQFLPRDQAMRGGCHLLQGHQPQSRFTFTWTTKARNCATPALTGAWTQSRRRKSWSRTAPGRNFRGWCPLDRLEKNSRSFPGSSTMPGASPRAAGWGR